MNYKLRSVLILFTIFLIIIIINGKVKKKEIILSENNYNIDYNDPKKYINSGKQSTITDKEFEIIKKELNIDKIDLYSIKKICEWKKKNFKGLRGGGKLVGKNTINNILKTRELTGCHDDGLVLASIIRKFGTPAVFVDTTAIQWSLDYPNIKRFSGHVFVEVFLDGNWLLFDSNSGEYIDNYNPLNPVIPIVKQNENRGYFVMYKGLDPMDYGITAIDKLNDTQKTYAKELKKEINNLIFPEVIIKRIQDIK